MQLTTIGTGTAAPHPHRVAAGHLVQCGETSLLLDCGSGVVHRMATLGVDWPAITHVAISHFHADHIADLAMLIMAWKWGQLPPRDAPVTLYGPAGFGDLMERLAKAFGEWVLAPGFPLTVREIAPDETLQLPSGIRLSAHPVPHTSESVAYSISDGTRRLVFTGDTPFDEALGRWAVGCDVLLAECSLPDSMAVAAHMTPRQVGRLAAIAAPRRLVLTHLYAPVEQTDIAAEVGEHFTGETIVAHDGFVTQV